MKKKFSNLCLLILFLIFFTIQQEVSACALGVTPFFKMNGIITEYYPLMLVSESLNTELNFPQDQAPKNYLIHEDIHFEVDKSLAPFSPEVLKNVELSWDYGDGIKAVGFKNTHAFNKPGSYFLTIQASSKVNDFDPYLLESVLIHILPDKNYQLPKAVLKVDNQQSQKPSTDIIEVDWSNVIFDGTASTAPSSKITSYTLDFGNRQQSNEKIVHHSYTGNLPALMVFPILRIQDANGFISDAFVRLGHQETLVTRMPPTSFNQGNFIPDIKKQTPSVTPSIPYPFIVGFTGFILIMVSIFIVKVLAKKN